MPFVFNTTARIIAGAGSLPSLAELGCGLLGRRVMVITDPGIKACGLVDGLLAVLRDSKCDGRFRCRCRRSTRISCSCCRRSGARLSATGVIGFGGGSAMDVAKLVALLAMPSSRPLAEAYGVNLQGNAITARAHTDDGRDRLRGHSDRDRDCRRGGKERRRFTGLIPDLALLDAELTLAFRNVTAATGIDAMVHAIEAYTSVSPNNNPISRMLAREALRLLGANLTCVEQGSNLPAREHSCSAHALRGKRLRIHLSLPSTRLPTAWRAFPFAPWRDECTHVAECDAVQPFRG